MDELAAAMHRLNAALVQTADALSTLTLAWDPEWHADCAAATLEGRIPSSHEVYEAERRAR
jgi:hypothetical protein